jgi:CO/xanthine dehydrogenase FAD-binding subunit
MKAAEFDYVRAGSIAEACEALSGTDDGSECKVIAGGQTLVPLMAMRLARPALLVDINDIAELTGHRIDDGWLAIRACTRQRAAEISAEVAEAVPLLAKALPFVGHWQTRNRGTVGGSLACADPSAEIPLVATALEAEMVALSSARGERRIAARDYFEAAMVTSIEADEILTEARFPLWAKADRVGCGFHEVASRRGDFAIVSAAAQVALDGDGVCRRATVAVGGASPTPVRFAALSDALIGGRLDDAAIVAVAAEITNQLDPDDDLHATADYRRRVAARLAERALRDARDDALGRRGVP